MVINSKYSLTTKQESEIKNLIKHYPTTRGACIDSLKIIQRDDGWVSDEALIALSEILSMTVEEIDGIATFYSQIFRMPVGRHIIRMCDSMTCFMTGQLELEKEIINILGISRGETTKDNRFTFLPVCCLGACDKGAVFMIDDDLYGKNINLPNVLELYK